MAELTHYARHKFADDDGSAVTGDVWMGELWSAGGFDGAASMAAAPKERPLAAAPTANAISLATAGTPYTQAFNSLATSGTANALTIPGFTIVETGGGGRDNELYAADTGASNTGDTYSYVAAGSSDRALGGLQSGTLVPTINIEFANNTGAAITSLAISRRIVARRSRQPRGPARLSVQYRRDDLGRRQ